MTAPVRPALAEVTTENTKLDPQWQLRYLSEYAHLLHDVDSDSTVPPIFVSLVKAPKQVA